MKQRTTKFSPNRRITEVLPDERQRAELASAVGYGGNPEHKRNPGDFGLEPPAQPRLGKTLCDEAGVFSRAAALELLREGVKRGLLSEQPAAGRAFPQMIWAVTDKGVPLEARIENPGRGIYHGYPMPVHDPLRPEVLRAWRERAQHGREGGVR